MALPLDTELAEEIQRAVSGRVRFNIPLEKISRWQIGGPAAAIVEPTSDVEVAAVMGLMHTRPEPLVIIGETSNILFDSRGFNGVLMRIGPRMSEWTIEGNYIHAQAGAQVPQIVQSAAREGLGGITHAAGIPGTLGGLVFMNGGTQRKGVGDHVASVRVVDGVGMQHTLTRDRLDFKYRASSFQDRDVAIVSVVLELENADSAALLAEVDACILERASKFPLDLPNCGSTFLSDPAMYQTVGPPGRAIEQAGLKGRVIGRAQISERHANFIVNLGGASDIDVLSLILLIRQEVMAQTGFLMDCEVRHLSLEGILRPAHDAAISQDFEKSCT